MGVPKNGCSLQGEIPLKWMILGNPHMHPDDFRQGTSESTMPKPARHLVLTGIHSFQTSMLSWWEKDASNRAGDIPGFGASIQSNQIKSNQITSNQSINLTINLSIYQSTNLSIYQSIYLPKIHRERDRDCNAKHHPLQLDYPTGNRPMAEVVEHISGIHDP